MLQPHVLTATELEAQKKEAEASQDIARAKVHDPYDACPELLDRLSSEYSELSDKLKKMATDRCE